MCPMDASRAVGQGDGLGEPVGTRNCFFIAWGGLAGPGAWVATHRLQPLESLGSPLLTFQPRKQGEGDAQDTFPPSLLATAVLLPLPEKEARTPDFYMKPDFKCRCLVTIL